MHVVTAAHDFYPDPGSGGTGRYVYETARRLAARGHRVSVVTRRRSDAPLREVVDDVVVYRFDLETAERPLPAVLAELPRARSTVARHVADIAERAPPDLLSPQGPVTARLVGSQIDAGVSRVPTFHSPWPLEYWIRTSRAGRPVRRRLNAAARWCLERDTLSRADQVVTLSEFMREKLERVYGLAPDATVVPGGVDVDRYAPSAGPSERLTRGDPAFLTVRRLTERMGHDLLLSAFAAVAEQHPGAHLNIAGDGPLRARIERTASAMGLDDRTTFLGYVPDVELPAVYAAADVFVLPTSELEGFGLATLEALASGTPVVATPVGGTVEVLSGLASEPDVPAAPLASAVSADALARGMLEWAALPASALVDAGRACRRYACERYRWERTVSRLEACYERVVA